MKIDSGICKRQRELPGGVRVRRHATGGNKTAMPTISPICRMERRFAWAPLVVYKNHCPGHMKGLMRSIACVASRSAFVFLYPACVKQRPRSSRHHNGLTAALRRLLALGSVLSPWLRRMANSKLNSKLILECKMEQSALVLRVAKTKQEKKWRRAT